MKSIHDTAAAVGLALGITLSVMVGVTLTVLSVAGWKTEQEKSDTVFSIESGVKFERHTDRRAQEGGTAEPEADRADDAHTPYVGGNYVSARSTMRYVMDDSGGRVKMYGYDVMRGRRVSVGAGRMTGRLLVIPDFYSFLDDTYGTLKLRLSEDGRTFEGVFEGMNAAQRGAVTLIRVP